MVISKMQKTQIMKQISQIIRYFFLCVFLLLSAQQAVAKNTQFRFYNQEGMRPKPPTIVAVNGVSVAPTVSYQNILDGLSSDTYEIRESAALALYKERGSHSYSIDLLMPMLQDDSELVTQYVSSAIVDVVNKRPATSRSLQGYFTVINATFNSSGDAFTRANCIAILSWATDDFKKNLL